MVLWLKQRKTRPIRMAPCFETDIYSTIYSSTLLWHVLSTFNSSLDYKNKQLFTFALSKVMQSHNTHAHQDCLHKLRGESTLSTFVFANFKSLRSSDKIFRRRGFFEGMLTNDIIRYAGPILRVFHNCKCS